MTLDQIIDEEFSTARAEDSDRLAQLETEQEKLLAEDADGERQIDQLKDEHRRRVVRYTQGLRPGEALAAPRWRRLQDHYDVMRRKIADIRGGRPARLKVLEADIAELRLSVTQSAAALQAEKPRQLPEVIRRPQPVEEPIFTLAASG